MCAGVLFYWLAFSQAVSNLIAVGTSHGLVLVFGKYIILFTDVCEFKCHGITNIIVYYLLLWEN